MDVRVFLLWTSQAITYALDDQIIDLLKVVVIPSIGAWFLAYLNDRKERRQEKQRDDEQEDKLNKTESELVSLRKELEEIKIKYSEALAEIEILRQKVARKGK